MKTKLNNEKMLGEKLATFIEHTGLNKSQFAKRVNMDYAHLFRIIRGDTNPGIDSLRKITEAFPKFSLNWLIGSAMENDSKMLHDLKVLLFDEMDQKIGSLELPDMFSEDLEGILQRLVEIYAGTEVGLKRIETYSSDMRNVDEEKMGKPY